jgi:hypothetical protein
MDDRTRRRKLIQGSLAAPLVLTIGRAGANARTTFSACLNESAQQPEPVHAVVEEDEAFRITRDVYEIHRRDGQGGDNPRKPDDIGRRDGEKPTRSYDQGQGGWGSGNPGKAQDLYIMGWNDETLYRIDGSRLVPQQVGFGRSFEFELRPTGKKVDILAYLDDNGEVVGIAPQRNGGEWTTKRCYASIVGTQGDDEPRRYRWWG